MSRLKYLSGHSHLVIPVVGGLLTSYPCLKRPAGPVVYWPRNPPERMGYPRLYLAARLLQIIEN